MFGTEMAQQQAEDKYGLADCPSPGPRPGQQPRSSGTASARKIAADLEKLEYLANDPRVIEANAREAAAATGTEPTIILRDPTTQKDVTVVLPDPDPQVNLFMRGRSEVAAVQFDLGSGDVKTFIIPIRYQRFWLDAGGFFVFSRRTDQQLDAVVVPDSTPELKVVRAIRSETLIEPNTGIVINVHPGNYPVLAIQFGIAASQGRSPSYYLGLGLRAREIGKRGLATIAVGAAMQQEQQYPLMQVGDIVRSDSTLLQAKQRYGITFPYISISLGFSFGGVAEKTDVRAAVVRNN